MFKVIQVLPGFNLIGGRLSLIKKNLLSYTPTSPPQTIAGHVAHHVGLKEHRATVSMPHHCPACLPRSGSIRRPVREG